MKNCFNCKYQNCSTNEYPCSKCGIYSLWEERKKEESMNKELKTITNKIYGTTADGKKNPWADLMDSMRYLPSWSYSFKLPIIKNVIFNDPATIVFWADGTKTVVKCQEGDTFDPEKGLAMAISKKAMGNKRDYYLTFKKWLKKYEKSNERKTVDLYVDGKPVLTLEE